MNRSEELTDSLLESNMETSQVYIHGANIQQDIRIIDKSKRAYDISLDATRRLEQSLQKDRKRWKHLWPRFQSVVYSVFILLLKFHGAPPTSKLNLLFLIYSLILSFDMVLSTIFVIHIFNPVSNMFTLGFAFLFILPGLTLLAPVVGLIATLAGSPRLMTIWSSLNATISIVNYPLCLISLLLYKDQAAYIGLLMLLWFNKIFLSFFGGKVRQHYANPSFVKTNEKMQKALGQMLAADSSGRFKGIDPAERAQMLVKGGKPKLGDDSDEEQDIEKDLFGITSTSELKKP